MDTNSHTMNRMQRNYATDGFTHGIKLPFPSSSVETDRRADKHMVERICGFTDRGKTAQVVAQAVTHTVVKLTYKGFSVVDIFKGENVKQQLHLERKRRSDMFLCVYGICRLSE